MSPVVRHRLPTEPPQLATSSSPQLQRLKTMGRPVAAMAFCIAV